MADNSSPWAPVSRRIVDACKTRYGAKRKLSGPKIAPTDAPTTAIVAAAAAKLGRRARREHRKQTHREILSKSASVVSASGKFIPPDDDRSLSRSFSHPTEASRNMHDMLQRACLHPPLRERPAPTERKPKTKSQDALLGVLGAADAPPSRLSPVKERTLRGYVADADIFSDQRAAAVMDHMLNPIATPNPNARAKKDKKKKKAIGKLPPEKGPSRPTSRKKRAKSRPPAPR